jgi:sugar/nucleoside kinase (ribokinase family)
MSDLVVIGGVALDYLSRVKDIKAGCTQVTEYSENLGGMAYNTAITTSQLGIRTRLVSAVGQDFPMIKNRKNLILDLHLVDGMTTRSFLFFDENEERIYFYRGAYHDIDIQKTMNAIEKAQWIHFAGVIPCFKELVAYADDENKLISFNPGYDLFHYESGDSIVKALLKRSDYTIMSSEEAKHLSLPIDSIVNGAVIVTMGKNGSMLAEKKDRYQIPSYSVDVESPFGAGDTYTDAFISAVMNDNTIPESAKLASAAASFAVEERTTTPNLDWTEIEKRAKKL